MADGPSGRKLQKGDAAFVRVESFIYTFGSERDDIKEHE